MHSTRPSVYHPFEQALHSVDPSLLVYEPALHGWHGAAFSFRVQVCI